MPSAGSSNTPRPCAPHQPDHQQLQASGPRLRGPGESGVQPRNRSASIRIPMYSTNPKAKRIEFRCPDGSANSYLAFSGMLMAILDGIKNKLKPGEPLDKDIYDLEPEELAKVPQAPGSLDEALNNLEKDHAFLLQGDVFTKDIIETWISYKREKEADACVCGPIPMSSCSITTSRKSAAGGLACLDAKPAGPCSCIAPPMSIHRSEGPKIAYFPDPIRVECKNFPKNTVFF